MTAGYDIPPEENDHLKTLVQNAADPSVKAGWDILRALQDDVKNWRKLTPVQLEREIQTALEPALHKNGASSFELERYEAARSLLSGMQTQIKTDPLGWASAQGLTTLPPLDMNDPSSLQARAAVAESVKGLYGTTAFLHRLSWTPFNANGKPTALNRNLWQPWPCRKTPGRWRYKHSNRYQKTALLMRILEAWHLSVLSFKRWQQTRGAVSTSSAKIRLRSQSPVTPFYRLWGQRGGICRRRL